MSIQIERERERLAVLPGHLYLVEETRSRHVPARELYCTRLVPQPELDFVGCPGVAAVSGRHRAMLHTRNGPPGGLRSTGSQREVAVLADLEVPHVREREQRELGQD